MVRVLFSVFAVTLLCWPPLADAAIVSSPDRLAAEIDVVADELPVWRQVGANPCNDGEAGCDPVVLMDELGWPDTVQQSLIEYANDAPGEPGTIQRDQTVAVMFAGNGVCRCRVGFDSVNSQYWEVEEAGKTYRLHYVSKCGNWVVVLGGVLAGGSGALADDLGGLAFTDWLRPLAPLPVYNGYVERPFASHFFANVGSPPDRVYYGGGDVVVLPGAVSEVPLPGALVLFGTVMVFLGLWKQRVKRAA